MKFQNKQEEVIYYWEKAKKLKEKGDRGGYIEYLAKAHELKEIIKEEEQILKKCFF